jgi:hypothetical protein
MVKKVTEKEKFYRRAVKSVERMVAEGTGLTQARQLVAMKFGIGYANVVNLTLHLSPRAQEQASDN